MRVIQLYTADTDKRGKRREAGEELTVGTDAKSDIDPDKAKKLVDRKAAAVIVAAKSSPEPKPSAKKVMKRKPSTKAKPSPAPTPTPDGTPVVDGATGADRAVIGKLDAAE